MTDSFHVSMLLDFYGQLLTERTRDLLEQYYSEDMSLSEIADNESVTRQTVHDTIRRGEKALVSYEDKLGLVERFMNHKQSLLNAIDAIDRQDIDRTREILQQLLQTL